MAASTPITIFGNGNGNNVVTAVSNVPQNGSSGAFPADLEKQPFWMSFSFYSYHFPTLPVFFSFYLMLSSMHTCFYFVVVICIQ